MENGKWKISGNNTKDGFGNQPNPTLSNVSKPHNLKKRKVRRRCLSCADGR